MSIAHSDPIGDDELLFRRIPVSQNWYAPGQPISPEAFKPLKDDVDGISLWRENYRSLADVARGPSPHGYFVAVLSVCRLRSAGIDVRSTPDVSPGAPGHVSIPALRYDNRRDDASIQMKATLARLVERVEGPFFPGNK